jgi:hypothetical protein
MDLAEEAPDLFGMSVVFQGKHEEQLDEDGKPKKDAQGGRLPRLARLDRLFAADVVDEPAANPTGMFSQDSLASKAHAFLDKWWEAKKEQSSPEEPTLTTGPEEGQFSQGGNDMEKKAEEKTPEPVIDTVALQNEARAEERTRVSGIHALGAKLGCSSEMLGKLVEDGTSLEDSMRAIIEDAGGRQFTEKNELLGKVVEGANPTSGVETEEGEELSTPVVAGSPEQAEQIAREEWAKDKKLQEEFQSVGSYVSFKRHEKHIKILGKK